MPLVLIAIRICSVDNEVNCSKADTKGAGGGVETILFINKTYLKLGKLSTTLCNLIIYWVYVSAYISLWRGT
jgi:hypothetical protein